MSDKDNAMTVPSYLKVGKIIGYAMYVWVLYGIIVLGLSVFLQAFSANPDTPFVKFIYNTSSTFLEPFRGIFPSKPVNQTGYIDVAAIFAMIIYGFVAWGFSALIDYVQIKIDAAKRAAALEQLRKVAAKPVKPVAASTTRGSSSNVL